MLAKKHIDADTGFRYRYIQSETEYFRLHCHEYFEIFLTLQGDIAHIINGRCEQLREGSLVLIRPDDIHDYKYQSGDLYRFINLAFDRETAQSLFIFLGRQACEDALLSCAMPPVVRLSAGEKEKLLLLFQGINAVQRNDALQAKTQMRLLLAQVVAKYFLAVPPRWRRMRRRGWRHYAGLWRRSCILWREHRRWFPFPAGARNILRA